VGGACENKRRVIEGNHRDWNAIHVWAQSVQTLLGVVMAASFFASGGW
jgi:hypothetical protein